MEKVDEIEHSTIVKAVLLWTGWGRDAKPCRDDSLLVNHFGVEISPKLLSIVKSLEDDFYSSKARFIADDLHEMEKLSSKQFREKHPEVADEIVKAFAWCYAFDYK